MCSPNHHNVVDIKKISKIIKLDGLNKIPTQSQNHSFFLNSWRAGKGKIPGRNPSVWLWQYSFVYTSGHCRRWRSRMEVKIVPVSLFVHCKIAYFYLVTAEKWLVVLLLNFLTMRKALLSILREIFSWIRTTKLKIQAIEFCDFITDFVVPSIFCTLVTDRNEHMAARADSSLSNRRASLSRSLPTDVSLDSRISRFCSRGTPTLTRWQGITKRVITT